MSEFKTPATTSREIVEGFQSILGRNIKAHEVSLPLYKSCDAPPVRTLIRFNIDYETFAIYGVFELAVFWRVNGEFEMANKYILEGGFKNPLKPTRSELVYFEETYGCPWVVKLGGTFNEIWEVK